jgi:hypothetical protein
MSDNEHITLSDSSETQPSFQHQELMQYKDGETSLVFRTPGDVVILGDDSPHKYARHLGPDENNFAIIKTKENSFGVGGGVIADGINRTVVKLPTELNPIVIGEPWEVHGLGLTDEVEGVSLMYKTGQGDHDLYVDKSGPWKQLTQGLHREAEKLYDQQV